VLGDSVAQAAQFATTGNAVGGLLAYSLVLSPAFATRGAYAVIPQSDHPPLRQRMVLLKRAGTITSQFYEYLQGGVARRMLEQHGFTVPR
jgi:molybdate transport system substrate-binding protein